jgi:hypothetical protein
MNPPRCALLRRTRPSSPSRPLARQISAAAGCIALYLALTACGAAAAAARSGCDISRT